MVKSDFTLPKFGTAIFLVLALAVLYFISRHNYNLFHSFADGISIVIAASVFTIIWNGRRIVDNDYFLYVGIAFLFFAFWDLMHLLGNKNMGVLPRYGNLGPVLYIVSRYTLSISLIIAPLFINRKLNTTLMYALYSLLTLLTLLSIFYWQIFPVCIVEGVGLTPFKVVSDYIICLILLGSIGLLLINRRSFDSRVLRLIVFSIILSIATGLAFTLYADPFGIMNAIGHFFQIASFYLIYLAFIETSLTKPQDILYQKLKKNEGKLAESVEQLNDANAELKQEATERKRVEEALRESEGRYALTLDAVNDGLWDWNVLSGSAFFSPHYYLILGYDDGGFPASYESWRLLVHPEDLNRVEEELRQSIESGRGFAIDLRMKLKSGGWQWVSTRGKVVKRNGEGKALRMVGTLSDITDRKRAEETLKEEGRRLQQVLDEVRTLRGIVPICSYCKKIRDDDGYWSQVERYVSDHTEAKFSHGICPACFEKEMKSIESSS
jgi:PAS domain S-box-containing protein